MKKSKVIIINGLPGTGKTTLSQKLAEKLGLVCLNKDVIKETIFEELGYEDRAWSKKVGNCSYSILYPFLEQLLKAGQNLIFESNFKEQYDSKKFQELQRVHGCEYFQILCEADGKVLYQRFVDRVQKKERHPGHCDEAVAEEQEDLLLNGVWKPLDIPGELLRIDTTDFSNVDHSGIQDQLRKFLHQIS